MKRFLIPVFFFLVILLAPDGAFAKAGLTIDLGDTDTGSFTGRLIQMFVGLAIISLAPSILIMVTSFTRLVVVFSFLRSALGLQQSPPNMVLISLALFLTGFIMAPTLEKAYDQGLKPLIAEEITEEKAMGKIIDPFHEFMRNHARPKDVSLFMDLGKIKEPESAEKLPLKVLVPAFMISELKRAFEIGFLLFIPFLIIDLVVASILMSMGMMMLPPVMISLPFKIIFFVLVDGWHIISGSLVRSFGGG